MGIKQCAYPDCNVLIPDEEGRDFCKKCIESQDKNEITTCRNCDILSGKTYEGYCLSCALSYVDHFKIVRGYLYDNPNSTIKDVHEATGVPIGEITKYANEGRITIKNKTESNSCINCGNSIPVGLRKCSFCRRQEESLQSSTKKQSGVEFHVKRK